jgi:hypothetical protein
MRAEGAERQGGGARAGGEGRTRHAAHATASGMGVYRDTPPPRRGEASFRGGRRREALSTLYRLKLCRSVGLRGERCPGEPRRRSLVMRSCAE